MDKRGDQTEPGNEELVSYRHLLLGESWAPRVQDGLMACRRFQMPLYRTRWEYTMAGRHDADIIHGSAIYQYWGIRRIQNEHPSGMYRS